MENWEISWVHDLPLVRDQGPRPSCTMESMMYSGMVINGNNRRRGILVPEITTFHHDSFVTNYELSTGTLLGASWNLFDPVRAPTALHIFHQHGVAAVHAPSWYGYDLVKISGYQAHDHVSFEQIKHYVSLRHPVLAIFPVRPDFGYFPAGLIYSVSDPVWWDDTHMVMVCGRGMWYGYPYLVYLNRFGWWWGQYGVGRVFLNQILQWPGTQHVIYTLEMDGVTVPVMPHWPRPSAPPCPDSPPSPPHSGCFKVQADGSTKKRTAAGDEKTREVKKPKTQ